MVWHLKFKAGTYPGRVAGRTEVPTVAFVKQTVVGMEFPKNWNETPHSMRRDHCSLQSHSSPFERNVRTLTRGSRGVKQLAGRVT